MSLNQLKSTTVLNEYAGTVVRLSFCAVLAVVAPSLLVGAWCVVSVAAVGACRLSCRNVYQWALSDVLKLSLSLATVERDSL